MEKSIQKAGKEVMVKRYKKQKKQILGYNEEIRLAIRERRLRCSDWKREKDTTKKEDLEKRYKEQKRLVVEMMDETEGKEISRIIDETGKKNRLLESNEENKEQETTYKKRYEKKMEK